MDTPAALITHYSSLAFYTRLAALTFVGAIIGAMIDKLKAPEVSHVVGLAVLLVIFSLGELNRRYTHAYLAALHAASRRLENDSPEGVLTSARWRAFRRANELAWPSLRSRFFLSWLTYIPGLALGEYLLLKRPALAGGWIGIPFGLALLSWWIWISARRTPLQRRPPGAISKRQK